MLTYSARNFHLAYQIGYFDAQDTIDKIIKNNKIFSDELISLLKISLLNYFAAALLMPYESFLIKDGESFSIIKNRLEDLKITIPFLVDFYFYTSGADKSLRKGEYLIDKGSDLFSFSTNLAKGKIYYRSFYIPEGSIVTQFLSDKEQNSFCNYKGLEECELEGMFHPF